MPMITKPRIVHTQTCVCAPPPRYRVKRSLPRPIDRIANRPLSRHRTSTLKNGSKNQASTEHVRHDHAAFWMLPAALCSWPRRLATSEQPAHTMLPSALYRMSLPLIGFPHELHATAAVP